MTVKIVHDPKEVFELLQMRERTNYVYQFSNLDEQSWKRVITYGLYQASELQEIAMVNINYELPVLLATSFAKQEYNVELLQEIKPLLPLKFYAHMDRFTLERSFTQEQVFDNEEYLNMRFCGPLPENPAGVSQFGEDKLAMMKSFLDEHYLGNWFEDHLAKLGKNYGVMINGKLVSFAGVHAYSERYQVAAVAHVVTDPKHRRKGYGERSVLALLHGLVDIKHIGLNVRSNNQPAISCYAKLGFKPQGRFMFCTIESK